MPQKNAKELMGLEGGANYTHAHSPKFLPGTTPAIRVLVVTQPPASCALWQVPILPSEWLG